MVIESFESVFDHFICGIVADAVPIADVVRLKFFSIKIRSFSDVMALNFSMEMLSTRFMSFPDLSEV